MEPQQTPPASTSSPPTAPLCATDKPKEIDYHDFTSTVSSSATMKSIKKMKKRAGLPGLLSEFSLMSTVGNLNCICCSETGLFAVAAASTVYIVVCSVCP